MSAFAPSFHISRYDLTQIPGELSHSWKISSSSLIEYIKKFRLENIDLQLKLLFLSYVSSTTTTFYPETWVRPSSVVIYQDTTKLPIEVTIKKKLDGATKTLLDHCYADAPLPNIVVQTLSKEETPLSMMKAILLGLKSHHLLTINVEIFKSLLKRSILANDGDLIKVLLSLKTSSDLIEIFFHKSSDDLLMSVKNLLDPEKNKSMILLISEELQARESHWFYKIALYIFLVIIIIVAIILLYKKIFLKRIN